MSTIIFRIFLGGDINETDQLIWSNSDKDSLPRGMISHGDTDEFLHKMPLG